MKYGRTWICKECGYKEHGLGGSDMGQLGYHCDKCEKDNMMEWVGLEE